MTKPGAKTWGIRAAIVWLAWLSTGCETAGYYGQAIRGQYEIHAHQQPIRRLIFDPATSEALREKFRAVMRIRDFAGTELNLSVNNDYLRYANLHRRFVVWNVRAAPQFSLKPKSWWYPVVGKLNYRGYFSDRAATACAERLAAKGFDVYVEGVEAYSTLGWFSDPSLSTFIYHPEVELAEILFHELAHQKAFAPGDTDFNEAFATAVAEEGIRRWLIRSGDAAAYEKYLGGRDRQDQFVKLILNARRQLAMLYGDPISDGLEPVACAAKQQSSVTMIDRTNRFETLSREKEKIINELRENYRKLQAGWDGFTGYDRWFDQPLNNAQLNAVATYYRLVPAFHALLQANNGNLESFYKAVRALTKLSKKERERQLPGPDPAPEPPNFP